MKSEYLKYNQLYVDMDNVLVDFDTRVRTVLFNKWNKEEGYKSPEYRSAIRDGLFLNLDPMPNMYDLWQTVEEYNPILLTSVAVVLPEVVAMDKRRWVDKHLGDHVPMITVSHSAEKSLYATSLVKSHVDGDINMPNLLIDDWDRAYVPFRENGGYAVAHKHNDETIAILNGTYNIRDWRLSEYK